MLKVLLLSIIIFSLCNAESLKITEEEYESSFKNYIIEFGKTYDPKDVPMRYQNFKENYEMIRNWKQEENTFSVGLTSFTDMSFSEFKSKMLMAPQQCSATHGNYRPTSNDNPTSIDWRDKGVVTPVKDQGNCGSCWTFSTTGCLEAHHAIQTGTLVSLSEQQLIDCAGKFKNHGCNGGLPSQAFEYIRYNKGLDTESSYPYRGYDSSCKFKPASIGATVTDVVNITALAENDLVDAVANKGPVSICFDVVSDFMHYTSGVYSSKRCGTGQKDVNHAVLAVGYNQTTSGTPYWIVKNSWGKRWGNEGYFWIARGNNACGAQCAAYPVVPSKKL